MELKPGTRLGSVVDETEVVVVRAPSRPVDLRCGGHPMIEHGAAPPGDDPDPRHRAGTLLGKRYVDPGSDLEVLCVRAGSGSLSVGSTPLETKEAKPLPSSD